MPQNKSNYSQKGNAFIIILAGVFLFAALMFTFTKSGQKGTGNLTKNQAKIAAQEILNYAQLVEGAVDLVRRNGCSENEINFSNAFISGYSNTAAPSNGSCDVFNSAGGKATFQDAQGNWTTGTNNWVFNAQFQITDIGSTCASASCADLSLNLEGLQTNVCQEINKSLFGDASIAVDNNYDATNFIGSFSTPTDIADEAGSSALAGVSTACFFSTADSQNIFYHVLLAR